MTNPHPCLKIYPRDSGWVAELWAIEQDSDGEQVSILVEIYAGNRSYYEALLRGGDMIHRNAMVPKDAT